VKGWEERGKRKVEREAAVGKKNGGMKVASEHSQTWMGGVSRGGGRGSEWRKGSNKGR